MKYIIMADGKGTRWKNYLDTPKHLIKINGEVLIERIVRQLKKFDPNSDIIITSHDERYEVPGATRYEPRNNILEIDRFTEELIEDDICFLYGDTYYDDNSIKEIVHDEVSDILFFGNNKSIVAIKIKDGNLFKNHVDRVRTLFLEGKIKNCKGWQVYQSFVNLEFDIKKIADKFVIVSEETIDYNTPKEYEKRKVRERNEKIF